MKAGKTSRAAPATVEGVLARRSGHGRLPTVRADFFLDPADRLTEQERALMSAMLHCLIAEIAGELRSALPDRRVHGGEESDRALIDSLNGAGLLDEADLIALLLRRADEERIATAAAARSGRSEARVLQGLVGHDQAGVAAAAMALILARGRRRDRLGQCLLAFDDLPPETAATLVHRTAAALKRESDIADGDLARASERVIARHDPAKSTERLAEALIGALDEAGRLGDELLLAAANEGELAILAHILSRSAGLPPEVAAGELLSGDAEAVVTVLRLAKVPRPVAAGLVAAIGDLLGIDDPAGTMHAFEALDDKALDKARDLLLSDSSYRFALAALGGQHG